MGIKISKDHLHPSVIESITSLIGDLNQLETTAKGNAVEAINELLANGSNNEELEGINESNRLSLCNLLQSKNIYGITQDTSFDELLVVIAELIDNKYYLYNKGLEYVDRTGGWVLRDTWTGGGQFTGSKNDDSLEVSVIYDCAGYIADNVYFTGFNKVYIEYEIIKNTDSSTFAVIVKDDYPYNSTILASNSAKDIGRGILTVDVSSVTGVHKLSCESYTGTSTSGEFAFKVYTIWME
jgi:hypothetical protein